MGVSVGGGEQYRVVDAGGRIATDANGAVSGTAGGTGGRRGALLCAAGSGGSVQTTTTR